MAIARTAGIITLTASLGLSLACSKEEPVQTASVASQQHVDPEKAAAEAMQRKLDERLESMAQACPAGNGKEVPIKLPMSRTTVTILGGTPKERSIIQDKIETLLKTGQCLRIVQMVVWQDNQSYTPATLKPESGTSAVPTGNAASNRDGLELVAFVDDGVADSIFLYDHNIKRALGEIVPPAKLKAE